MELVLGLQRSIGNAAVARLLQRTQRTVNVVLSTPVRPRGSARLLQRKELVVTLDLNLTGKRKAHRIEVGDDGKLSGASLFQQVLKEVPSALFAKYNIPDDERSSYITVRLPDGPVLCDATMYEIAEMTTVTVGVSVQKMEHRRLQAGGVDEELVKESKAADECIIGCYLLSRPGDEQALNEQQSLKAVTTAFETGAAYRLVLVDTNFTSAGAGQIVDFLKAKYPNKIVVSVDSSGDVTTHTITSFREQPANVKIVYVGRNVNEATEQAMTNTRWYSGSM